MFALAEEGHRSLYRQVVACILSVRTYDEVSLVAARRLFEAAPEPADLARLTPGAIDRLIGSVTFHRTKAGSIREIARTAAARPDRELPCDAEALLALPGVGPKCAHLALGIACGEQRISVDIHVHRVTNRWGLRPGSDARAHHDRARATAPTALLDRAQQPAGSLRQAHLHRAAAALLDLPRARHLPAGGGHGSPLNGAVGTATGDLAHPDVLRRHRRGSLGVSGWARAAPPPRPPPFRLLFLLKFIGMSLILALTYLLPRRIEPALSRSRCDWGPRAPGRGRIDWESLLPDHGGHS
jgi:endonuclease III